ncbi:polysaccharide pyruvyl transferase family protein [Roseateles sp.]|uniref:polysaccharide pyruvyl transferase family protein n=1 Tax=Roseateles sp. TaxID=1971397 RepID=UPI00391C6A61
MNSAVPSVAGAQPTDAQMLERHRALMASLKQSHEPLVDLLGKRELHYVDLPFHGNIGDLLIMAGTVAFLTRSRLRPAVQAMYFNYSTGACPPGGVIACHGGGNFGDIYGPFQAFRERLFAERKDCRIVVLPQSLHFSSEVELEKCVVLCRAHPDLHICVRDPVSQAMALRMTDKVYLMPDMAHQLWPLRDVATPAPRDGLLSLKRRDSEATAFSAAGQGFDWDDLVGPGWRFVLSNLVERPVTQMHLRLGMTAGNWLADWWIGRADAFVREAIALFSRHERVESDRLHAHILSCLLEIPNEIYDNSYGKNSRYISTWTHGSPLVSLRSNNDAQLRASKA